MTEHTYIRSIHRLLHIRAPEIYVWKINDNYQGGVADAYYSSKRDMWIEYKYMKALPKRPNTPLDLGLSALQQDWLADRHNQGRRIAVIIGSPNCNIVLPALEWRRTITCADFLSSSVDKRAVVDYIVNSVN
jgi:hypothetical protein